MPTVLKVVKIGGVLAVAATVCIVVGIVQAGGNSVIAWTIAGVWCMTVYSGSLIAALIIDLRRPQATR